MRVFSFGIDDWLYARSKIERLLIVKVDDFCNRILNMIFCLFILYSIVVFPQIYDLQFAILILFTFSKSWFFSELPTVVLILNPFPIQRCVDFIELYIDSLRLKFQKISRLRSIRQKHKEKYSRKGKGLLTLQLMP